MQHDKLRLRMPREDAVARFQQLRVAWEVAAVKRPVRMVIQLFISLVEAVSGSEESDGIGNMNGHGHVELSARVPHGIEAGIVNLHQRAFRNIFAKIEPQSLQNLQAAGAVAVGLLDCLPPAILDSSVL